jgi:hypothetical protein
MEANCPNSPAQTGIRAMLMVNFAWAVLFLIPSSHRWVDEGFRALATIGWEDIAGRSLLVWLVGSTLLATALFTWAIYKNRATRSDQKPNLALDGTLLLAWWITVLLFVAYGFMLGMGG